MYSVNIQKIKILFPLLISLLLTGCMAKEEIILEYDNTSAVYGLVSEKETDDTVAFLGQDLCVLDGDINNEDAESYSAESSAVFGIDSREVIYADNVFERVYPASTTKIMTAIAALKYGDLNDIVTVSSSALNLESGSSVCNLKAGDQLTLEQCLYGLMIKSGNDAANAIAEHISGSNEAFAVLMNEEAKKIGAVDTNFVNPSGLHDENHYTTAYDLYLMFKEALKNETFVKILKESNYATAYTNAAGERVSVRWTTTNQYLTGDTDQPENITVIGGKTGTTMAAGSCLILLSEDQNGAQSISVIMKSDSRTTLYNEMTELLKKSIN